MTKVRNPSILVVRLSPTSTLSLGLDNATAKPILCSIAQVRHHCSPYLEPTNGHAPRHARSSNVD